MLELTWKAIDEKTIQASLNIDAAKLFLFPRISHHISIIK
jgi:hypothetical protein